MPIPLNTTIDDCSPLITYEPGGQWAQWQAPEPDQTFGYGSMRTQWQNASATLRYQGTSVTVFGSKDTDHGNYTVTLDGISYHLSGFGEYPGEFKTTIFISPKLTQGLHTLVISNDEYQYLDIDRITWSSDLGPQNVSDNAQLQETKIEDSDPGFSYFPKGTWLMNSTNLANFSNGTGHSTSRDQAGVTYTFSGDALSIYGTTGPENSQYLVQEDDQPSYALVATRDIFSPQSLLYHADNFGPGNHTVTLTNQTPGKLLEIDFAVVRTLASSSASSSSSVIPTTVGPGTGGGPIFPTQDPQPHKKLPAGAIFGIVAASLAFVVLTLALLYVLRRNKTLWMRLQRGYMVQSQFDSRGSASESTPLTYNTSPPARSKAVYQLANTDADDSFDPPPVNRANTNESHLSASTLVAEHGSVMTQASRNLKPLRLAARGGPSSSPSTSATTQSLSPSQMNLLRNTTSTSPRQQYRESNYYDPYLGLEEIPEDRVDDILRHPIQRSNPRPTHEWHWQSALP